jgi:hypothetical protein
VFLKSEKSRIVRFFRVVAGCGTRNQHGELHSRAEIFSDCADAKRSPWEA